MKAGHTTQDQVAAETQAQAALHKHQRSLTGAASAVGFQHLLAVSRAGTLLRPTVVQASAGRDCAPAAVPVISLVALSQDITCSCKSVQVWWPLTCCWTLLNTISIVAQPLVTQLEVGAGPHAGKGCCRREGRGRRRSSSCRCPMLGGHWDSVAARWCSLFEHSLLQTKGRPP